MPQSFLALFILSFWAIQTHNLKAQSAAFVGRFEHQTEVPLAYPDYFENQTWVNQMLKTTQEALKNRYNIGILDHKKRGTVNFIPGFRVPGEMKMFANTGYDLLISIVSRLETGLDSEKMRVEEGSLLILVEIWRPNDKRVFKNRAKAKFVIIPSQNDLAEVMMAEKDFQKMYQECLQAALQLIPKPQPYVFRQPEPEFLQAFLEKSEKITLYQKDRVTFEIDQQEDKILKLDLQSPYQQDKQYGRSGKLQNPFNTNNDLTLHAALFTNQTYSVQTEYREGETVLGNFSMMETPEKREIKGYFGEIPFTLTRGFLSGVARIEAEGKLIAMLIPQQNQQSEKQVLELYCSPRITQNLKANILTLLNVEILSEAVLKYYRLATGTGG